MAHPIQVIYCLSVKAGYPEFFKNKKVVDFGSLDINGCNRWLFDDCDYTGVDIGKGPNVDVVSKAHEFNAPDGTYDVVVSTEMFEHDKHLDLSLPNMVRVLKPKGLFFFTCAGVGREEHGTRRTSPEASPFTSQEDEGWSDFYENVTEAKIRSILDIDGMFKTYDFSTHGTDFRFFGIKK